MTQAELEALLGRPLIQTEIDNLDLYLSIANAQLEDLLCTTLDPVTEERIYDARQDYSTVFTDIFTEATQVKLDDVVVTNYSERQWDKRNADWFNSLVFDCKLHCQEVKVTADWGFTTLPNDLALVLAGLFDQISKKNRYDGTIQKKDVEDFSITFRTGANLDQEFADKYGNTLSKYSLCGIETLRQGKINTDVEGLFAHWWIRI